jgi:hypothetical protein
MLAWLVAGEELLLVLEPWLISSGFPLLPQSLLVRLISNTLLLVRERCMVKFALSTLLLVREPRLALSALLLGLERALFCGALQCQAAMSYILSPAEGLLCRGGEFCPTSGSLSP